MKSAELDYKLPPGLIAQRPLERRDESRLLVFDRGTGEVEHRRFGELPELLPRETLTVVNDTRVLPARLRLERPGGGDETRAWGPPYDEQGDATYFQAVNRNLSRRVDAELHHITFHSDHTNHDLAVDHHTFACFT